MLHSFPPWYTINNIPRRLQPFMPSPDINALQPLPTWLTQTYPLLAYPGAVNTHIYARYPFLSSFTEIPTDVTPQIQTKVKHAEPTTKKPLFLTVHKPMKSIQAHITDAFQNDVQNLDAVRSDNMNFVIYPVTGQLVYREATEQLQKTKKRNKKVNTKNTNVKVEASGHTATTGTVPEIPFGTYFSPSVKKPSALILEPHAKAIVGNGGTAISTPLSRAVLKRGVPTNVYFNPEAVAIAGVGGKAHAEADLELDVLNRRR